jgi:hypothetical protein
VEVAHHHDEDYNHFVELLTHELNNLKPKHRDVSVYLQPTLTCLYLQPTFPLVKTDASYVILLYYHKRK